MCIGYNSRSDNSKYEDEKKRCGPCVVCKENHTYKKKFGDKLWPTDRLFNCQKFKDMNKKQRGEILEKFKACVRCTSWAHKKTDCTMKPFICTEQIDAVQCRKDHSRLVCNSGIAYCLSVSGVSNVDPSSDESTISYLHDVKTETGEARVFWDTGSNRVLINDEFAEEHNLKKVPVTVVVNLATGTKKQMDTMMYELDLVDRENKKHTISGYGVPKIVDPEDPVDGTQVRSLFPHIPAEVFGKIPKKRADILVGLNYNGLFPSGGNGKNCVGNLKVLGTKFGSGWVIGGSHPNLRGSSPQFSPIASEIRISKIKLDVIPKIKIARTPRDKVVRELTTEFYESDHLGIEPPRRCDKCRKCANTGVCSEEKHLHSLQEEEELRLLEDAVTLVNNQVNVVYPFIKNPSCLPPNRDVAVKIASKLWRDLSRDGLLEPYNEEIRKYLERGTFVVVTKEELESYQGPHQWIIHHGVLKESASTPFCVVTNSSFNNRGNSLNSCLPKGPNIGHKTEHGDYTGTIS